MSWAAGRPGEFELIATYFRPLATDPAALSLKDDAALLRPTPGDELVITADMVAAGVHFFPDDPAFSIARKALAVNLSDLAAKGSVPFGYFLGLALPEDWRVEWLKDFTAGLQDEQTRHGISLLGGDTIKAAGGVTVSITAIGRVKQGEMVRRSGAKAGDHIYVSGTIGDAALGLQLRLGRLEAGEGAAHLLDRYLHPQPKLALAEALRRSAHAAMDVSDGLVGDLAHICRASNIGATIIAADVPLSDAARAVVAARSEMLATILTGGDDYEILAMVPEAAVGRFEADAAAAGVAVTRIGRVDAAGEGPTVIGRDGMPLALSHPSHVQF